MGRRTFVRLGRLSVRAKHRQQRCKRQDDQDSAADAVDLLSTHVLLPFQLLPDASVM